jgi:hypothetical protein
MQLKKKPGSLRLGLMAASCSLLGARALADTPAEAPVDEETPLQIDTGFQFYKENEKRVTSSAPVVSLRKDYGDERILNVGLVYDSMSGGSPNGAVPQKKLQTFATASGVRLNNANGTPITYTTPTGKVVAQLAQLTLYQILPGQQPIDPNFHEQRIALDSGWSQRFGAASHLNIGAEFSHELDYLSLGANAGLSHDFNQRHTTLGFGLNVETVSINTPGGAPVPDSDYRLTDKEAKKSKTVKGGMLNLTQVMTSHWVSELNLVYDKEHGYLTNPYKIMTVVDATGTESDYRFENSPRSRARKSIFWDNKVAIGAAVLDVSFRHGSDDWSVRGNTADARLRFNIYGEDIYLEPHLRWYHQTAASFYHLYLDAAAPLPTYISSDERLAEFTAKTFGVKLGFLLQDRAELTFRLEAYSQDPSQRSSPLAGLSGFDLNPSFRAITFQIGWRHGF